MLANTANPGLRRDSVVKLAQSLTSTRILRQITTYAKVTQMLRKSEQGQNRSAFHAHPLLHHHGGLILSLLGLHLSLLWSHLLLLALRLSLL